MRRPIFLDRDGVINREPSEFNMDYVTDIKYFIFMPGIHHALKLLIDNGYDIYIISNQAGVNKGLYSFSKLLEITDYMLQGLKNSGIEIKDVKYCIHRSEENCECRKPKTKFLEEIFNNYKTLDKTKVYFIGDQARDIETASNFGIKSILVLVGKMKFEDLFRLKITPDYVAYDLCDAVKNIVLG